jgi:hypothetical protein
MTKSLPFRQVHLDFHTSEHIPGIGERFDQKQFIAALKEGNVNSVTVFAKCHHGWSYYPTKVGKPHPNLKKQLLPEMIEACHSAGINVPVYFTVQWDELSAREHVEWRVIKADNQPVDKESSDLGQLRPTWHTLCVNHKEYIDYLIEHTLEVIKLYPVDGIFQDILLPWECVCEECLKTMRSKGLDPKKREDRLANHRNVILAYYERMHTAVHKAKPGLRLFHNSGHIYKNERERWQYFTHLELESLPTGGWGYDHFPVSARYVNTLGMEYLGMTGKFHTTWGEFGGFKRPKAFEYECLTMVALGARCSVGDQLHPDGLMDMDTYRLLGPAYRRVEKVEQFVEGATPVSEIAIFSAEGHHHDRTCEDVDMGAARLLLEEQIMFDIIDQEAPFENYKLIILPDVITLEGPLADKFHAFINKGGKLLCTGNSGLTPAGDAFALPFRATVKGMSEFSPDYLVARPGLENRLVENPFVVYERARMVKSTGAEVLAETRVPYFNRTWEHFCSHMHTPYRRENNLLYDGILLDGPVGYCVHPLCKAYYLSGQPLIKYAFRGLLNRLLPKLACTVTMPSSGRVSYMEQKDKKRKLLHLLFAQTQLRGLGQQFWGSAQKIEILEDAVTLAAVPCAVQLAAKPRRIYLGETGAEMPFTWENGVASFTVTNIDVHAVVVIEE